MRILHLLNDLSDRGNGIVNAAVDLACAQTDCGEIVGVASASCGYIDLLRKNGIEHFELVQRELSRTKMQNCALAMRAYLKFQNIVRMFKPQIVHCHMLTGFLIAHSCKRFYGYCTVAHVHNVHQESLSLMRFADRCIAVSSGVAAQMKKWKFPDGKVSVVTYGTVGTKRLSDLYDSMELQQPAIVTVAGLWMRKNIDGLIRAFNQLIDDHPEAHLYIVGEGDRSRFSALAKQSRAARSIHFEGFRQDPRPYMRAAKVFVLASHRESFGLVIQEARNVGTAVIGTNIDGIPDALDWGEAGILVPVGDDKALANAMCLILSNDQARECWRKAAQTNLQRHSVFRMCDEIQAVYHKLLPFGDGDHNNQCLRQKA